MRDAIALAQGDIGLAHYTATRAVLDRMLLDRVVTCADTSGARGAIRWTLTDVGRRELNAFAETTSRIVTLIERNRANINNSNNGERNGKTTKATERATEHRTGRTARHRTGQRIGAKHAAT
jgi:DNA-binding PadR family transcriptional regulator